MNTSTIGARLRMAALSFILPFVLASLLTGCGGDSSPKGGTMYLSIGTAPIGGAFAAVGGALAEVLNASRGENNWNVQGRINELENLIDLVKPELTGQWGEYFGEEPSGE